MNFIFKFKLKDGMIGYITKEENDECRFSLGGNGGYCHNEQVFYRALESVRVNNPYTLIDEINVLLSKLDNGDITFEQAETRLKETALQCELI